MCIDISLVSAHSPISNTSTLLSRESLPVVLILRELSSRDFAPLTFFSMLIVVLNDLLEDTTSSAIICSSSIEVYNKNIQ